MADAVTVATKPKEAARIDPPATPEATSHKSAHQRTMITTEGAKANATASKSDSRATWAIRCGALRCRTTSRRASLRTGPPMPPKDRMRWSAQGTTA